MSGSRDEGIKESTGVSLVVVEGVPMVSGCTSPAMAEGLSRDCMFITPVDLDPVDEDEMRPLPERSALGVAGAE